jgi:hypothetical protein
MNKIAKNYFSKLTFVLRWVCVTLVFFFFGTTYSEWRLAVVSLSGSSLLFCFVWVEEESDKGGEGKREKINYTVNSNLHVPFVGNKDVELQKIEKKKKLYRKNTGN